MNGFNILLTIGIRNYVFKERWKELPNAVTDCERVAKILTEKYSFTHFDSSPMVDQNASLVLIKHRIQEVVNQSFEADNLIIYFAGHGLPMPEKILNWIPQDGGHTRDGWINREYILSSFGLIRARHILLISDCCYSGLLTYEQPRLAPLNLSDDLIEQRNSRIILTSNDNNTVSDGKKGYTSPFCLSLCEVLESNKEKSIRITKIIDDVTRLTKQRSRQKPQSSQCKYGKNENGEMILRQNLETDDQIKRHFELPIPKNVSSLISRTLTLYYFNPEKDDMLFKLESENILLENILPYNRRVVVLGNPGTGKTIQLLKVANYFQGKGTIYVPFYKRLNQYSGGSIFKYLNEDFTEITENTLMLFLDGLDEIPPEYFREAVNELTELAKNHPLITMVISCRTNFYDLPSDGQEGLIPGFSIYVLNDITEVEIKEHFENEFDNDGDKFLYYTKNTDLSHFLSRPYTLNMLFDYYNRNGNLDVSRSTILEQNFRSALVSDKDLDIDEENFQIRKQTAQKLAFVMETMGKNHVSDSEVRVIFSDSADYEIIRKIPSLIIDEKTGIWMFTHNNIQEFLAAQILATLKLQTLIEIISIENAGKVRIKPSWVNTISFVASIIDDDKLTELFNWIAENDAEIITKFEPGRLSSIQSEILFTKIFEYYTSRDLWLSSNKFSPKDIARLVQSDKIITYLIDILEDNESSIVSKLNALFVFYSIDEDVLEHRKEHLLNVLVNMLNNSSFSEEHIHTIISVIAVLKLADRNSLNKIIRKFRSSRNQYIRAALYRLIVEMDIVDENISLILDGYDVEHMANAIGNRSDTNLIDESLNLSIAFAEIKTTTALGEVIKDLQSSQIKLQAFMLNSRDLFKTIIDKCIILYESDKEYLFDIILEFYTTKKVHLDNYMMHQISRFFKETNTQMEALQFIWDRMDQEAPHWESLTAYILDEYVVTLFIESVKSGEFSDAYLKKLHQLIYYNGTGQENLLNKLEEDVKVDFGYNLERPSVKNWKERELLLNKKGIDLLLNIEDLLVEVERLFNLIGKNTINSADLFTLTVNKHSDEDPVPNAISNLLRFFTYHDGEIQFDAFYQWIDSDSPGFQYHVLKELKNVLSNFKELRLTAEQEMRVYELCLTNSNAIDLITFFLHFCKFELPKENLLNLIDYIDPNTDLSINGNGSLELLEDYLSVEDIKQIVIERLEDNQLNSLKWIGFIFYGFRKKWTEIYNKVFEKLINTNTEEYKYNEILQIWFDRTADIKGLREIVIKTPLFNLKRNGINILRYDTDNNLDFIFVVLKEILYGEEEEEYKYEAANLLIEFGNIDGFEYLADMILETKSPTIDFRYDCRNFPKVTDLDALPKLMSLLELSKQDDFKKDFLNDLESIILETLIKVGSHSEESSEQVTHSIENFMNEQKGRISDLERLNFIIERILTNVGNSKSSEDVTSALEIFNQLNL